MDPYLLIIYGIIYSLHFHWYFRFRVFTIFYFLRFGSKFLIWFLSFDLFSKSLFGKSITGKTPSHFVKCWCLFVSLTMEYFSLLFLFNMFLVVASSYICQFLQRCQVNYLILKTRSVVGVKIIYISDEVTNRVNKFWPLDSWLLGRCLYWETDMRSPISTTMSS